MTAFPKNKQAIVKASIETLMCQKHKRYPTVTFDENDNIKIKSCCREHENGLMEDLPSKIDNFIRDYAVTEHYRRLFE